ncbi:hypothetical protein, partial [Rhodoplanes sp. SY1]|uniref:hypothetical protein n=1 Tax=Rhodoplanes sp. SY1 TaxID=3166646 RepID=UPI0038B490F2
MTTDRARRILIIASLAITGLQIVFLVIAPVVDYPLTYPKNLDLLQIVTPVFLGYLGSAAHFVFKPAQADETTASPYLGLLTVGPLVIYAAAVAA